MMSGHKQTWLLVSSVFFVICNATAGQDLSEEQINQTVKQVIDHNDFRSVRRRMGEQARSKGFLQRMIDRISEWLQRPSESDNNEPLSSVGEGRRLGGLSQLIMVSVIAFLVVLVALILFVIIRSVDSTRASKRGGFVGTKAENALKPCTPPGELAATIYEKRALQFAGEGNYRAAIRELLLGSMSWIERAGLIRFRRGLTNRDYLWAVWRQQDKRLAYESTASEFELVYFGRRTATPERFQNCLHSFQGAFREEVAASAKS